MDFTRYRFLYFYIVLLLRKPTIKLNKNQYSKYHLLSTIVSQSLTYCFNRQTADSNVGSQDLQINVCSNRSDKVVGLCCLPTLVIVISYHALKYFNSLFANSINQFVINLQKIFTVDRIKSRGQFNGDSS